MPNFSWENLEQILLSSHSILLPLHLRPDADSAGSVLAMGNYLKSLGKKVRLVSVDGFPSVWETLPGFSSIEIEKIDPVSLDLDEFDLIFFLDSENEMRVTHQEEWTQLSGHRIVNVDHHLTNRGFGEFSAVGEVCSATQMILKFFREIGFTPDEIIANNLYWGLIGDTGFFNFFGYDPDGLRAETALSDASLLVSWGAKHDEFVFQMQRCKDLESWHLFSHLVSQVQMDEKYHFAWIVLPKMEDFYNQWSAVSFDLKQVLISINETDFGFFIGENEHGTFVGFRARKQDGFDVSLLAKSLGGGGHRGAAGAILKGQSLPETEDLILERVRYFLENQKAL